MHMTVLSVLLSAVFLAVLFCFGLLVARRFLHIRSTVAVAGMAIAIGNAAYLVLCNILGYALPIHVSFWVTLAILAAAAAVLFLRRSEAEELSLMERPPRFVWVLLSTVIVLAGFAFARDEGSDTWLMIHFPLPATILQGNFPVMDPVNPWSLFAYHYGPALLAAAFSSLTGFSIAVGYAIQPLLNAASIVLIATGLAWELCRSWKASAVAGLLAFAGSGLYWLYVIPLGRELWDAYVLGQSVVPEGETPFRWLTYAIRNLVTNPPMMMLGHRPIGMGFAFLYASLFAIHRMFKEPNRAVRWVVVLIVLGAALAHALETTLVVLLAALAIFFGVLLTQGRRDAHSLWKTLAIPLLIFAIGVTAIALVQGGVLSTLPFRVGPPSFEVYFDGYLHLGGENNLNMLPLWGWEFFLIFGLPLVLFPFVLWHVIRREGVSSFQAFLCLLAGMHFGLPLFVHFLPRPHEMKRFFYVFMSLSAFLIALWLHKVGSRSRRLRLISGVCIAAMLLSATLHLPVRLTFPSLRIARSPLFSGMPETEPTQEEMYAWVARNTRRDDYFFMIVFGASRNRLRPPVTFAAHTGRFLIQVSSSDPEPTRMVGLMKDIEDHCDPAAFAALHIRYAVVETAEDEEWLRSHCDMSLWALRFAASGSEHLPRIYEFTRWTPPPPRT